MNIKRISILILLILIDFINIYPQLNQTDQNGLRQGHWIRKYPTGVTMYDGIFKDGHPVGEFKRYYENGAIKSVMMFSQDGRQADATLFFPNGSIASKGQYRDQKKEGRWQFYSSREPGYLICEQMFTNDLRNGVSLSFYHDSTIGDRKNYLNDNKNGEWEQFYQSGKIYIKAGYLSDKLNGPFEAWYENGTKMYTGSYRNDARDGTWLIYNEDGSVKYKIQYKNGVPDNHQMDADASKFIDSLESQKGNIPDPEITGEMWQ